jgi:lipopolysaccharide export system permease protein
MFRTDNDKTLVLKLKDGVRYSEQSDNKGTYDPREQFIRYRFRETEQKFDLSSFKLQRTDENLFKSSYGMLNLKQLNFYKDSTSKVLKTSVNTTFSSIKNGIKYFNYHNYIAKGPGPVNYKPYRNNILELLPRPARVTAVNSALIEITSLNGSISNSGDVSEDLQSTIRRYIIEYHRKFTLSVSCLILFSIGAPLGAIIRKGGLGLPVVMSIIFFLINHIISTIGEKFAREGDVSPILGMWIAIIALAPLGVFLTYKATVDSALFDIDYYKQAFIKLFKRRKAAL